MQTREPAVATRPVALLLLATLGSFACFHLLLSVVPLYAVAGGAGEAGAGAATAALMLSTVAAQLQVPRLAARVGYRVLLACGMVLLGAPALLLIPSAGLPTVVGVSLARGVGFGVVTVVGSALVAELVPPQRRGAGLGIYGVAVGLPSVALLPLGVWLAQNVGYTLVFILGAAAPLLALAAVPGIGAYRPHPSERRNGVLAGLRRGALLRPFLVLAGLTMASGAVVTFLPLAVPAASGALASAGLLARGAGSTLSRWFAGVAGDRFGPGRLVVPGVVAAAAGMLGMLRPEDALLLVGGMAVFGIGFGVVSNATLALMFDRVPRSQYGAVSAQWNVAFDLGTGAGAVGAGVVVEQAGFDAAFALLTVLLLALVGPAWRDLIRASRAATAR
ncbi:MAG: MFS transporter [Streptomycetales bacterium]